jgi:hypothetical protein
MDLLNALPGEVEAFTLLWLVPLFILFNIVGWVGLSGREARRSPVPPSEKDTSDLSKSMWAAWLVGVLLSLVGLTAIYKFYGAALQGAVVSAWAVSLAGIGGAALGWVRGFLPRLNFFRNLSALNRRRILAFLVICAVGVSIVCEVVYYNSARLARGVIASGYAWMLVAYAATYVFEVGK